MEGHLKKLHKAIETMTGHRRDLASTSTSLANSIATLGELIIVLALCLTAQAMIVCNLYVH